MLRVLQYKHLFWEVDLALPHRELEQMDIITAMKSKEEIPERSSEMRNVFEQAACETLGLVLVQLLWAWCP